MKRKTLILILIISIITTSCSIFPSLDIDQLDAGKAVTFLASDAMAGRMTGTSGNLRAQEAIVAAYEKIGLEKYSKDSYLVDYRQAFYDPYKQEYSMKIIDSNNKTRVCIYGEDYMYSGGGSVNISTPLIFDIRDIGLGDCAIALEKKEDLGKVRGKVKAVLLKKDVFMKGSPSAASSSPIIQISPKLYEIIKASNKPRLEISFEVPREEITVSNIVGKISGKNNKSAIVLSAHFDHVGVARQSVYNGALDNASGTAVMLCVAKKLKAYSLQSKLDCDILICAFNGEEYGLKGSASFVGDLGKSYDNIYDINIDCVGQKSDKLLLVTGDQDTSKELMSAMQKHMTTEGFKCKEAGADNYRSDHLSFSDKNYSAVCLATETINTIHTTLDTADTLDFAYLDKLVAAIFKFVTANADKHYKSPVDLNALQKYGMKPEDIQLQRTLEGERKSLKFGEYKLVKIGEKNYNIENFVESFDSYKSLMGVYPMLNIPENLGKYKVSRISLGYLPQDYDMRDLEPDIVYYRELFQKDIRYGDCTYEGNDMHLQIGFYISESDEQYKNMIKYFYERNDKDPKEFYVDGRPYSIVYNKGTREIARIDTVGYAGTKPVLIYLYAWSITEYNNKKGGAIHQTGFGTSREENIKRLKKIELNKFVEEFLESLRE